MYRIRRYSLPVSELHILSAIHNSSLLRKLGNIQRSRPCMKTVRPAQFSTRVSAVLKLIYLQVSRTSVYGTKIKTGIVCVCKLGNEWLLLPSVADYPALSNVRRKTVCSQCGYEKCTSVCTFQLEFRQAYACRNIDYIQRFRHSCRNNGCTSGFLRAEPLSVIWKMGWVLGKGRNF